jgi:hypothetical protein
MSLQKLRWPVLFLGCLCGGVAGCKDTVVEVVPVSEIVVSPPSANLSLGGSQQLAATLKGSGGHTLGGRAVNWSSTNTSVAAVNQDGLVTGVGAGTATITATSEGRSGSAAVTVPTYLLTVTMAGPGNGILTSSPAGIECPGTCQASFASGVVVTLEARTLVGGGDFFDGWSGACSGRDTSCQVTMSGARSVTATFGSNRPQAVQTHGFTEVYPNTAYYAWSYSDQRADKFVIDYRVGGAAWTSVEFPATTRAVVASDLPDGYFLEFRIRACNVWGCSAYSTIASASAPLTPTVTKLAIPSTLTSLSGALLSRTYYRVYVPPSANLSDLTIKTFGGTGDVDLYVRQGRVPSTADEQWDCKSATFGNADSCSFANPSSGDFYILLYAFGFYSGVTLEVTAAGGGASAAGSHLDEPRPEGPRIKEVLP